MENENVDVLEETKAESVENSKKLYRKHGAKKVLGISVMVVLIAIILTITICSFLPKSYNFGFETPSSIEIHTSDSSSPQNKRFVQKDSAEYKKIMSLYNESFNTKVLTAFLQGKINQNVKVQEGYKSISSISGPYLVFCYSTSQKVVLNGKEYNADIVSDSNFIEVVIEVKNTTSLTEINAYFKYRDTGLNNYSYVRFSTLATQSNLYNYIENM